MCHSDLRHRNSVYGLVKKTLFIPMLKGYILFENASKIQLAWPNESVTVEMDHMFWEIHQPNFSIPCNIQ